MAEKEVKEHKLRGIDRKILWYLYGNPALRVITLMKLTNLKKRNLYKRLNSLRRKGLIENHYPNWKIINSKDRKIKKVIISFNEKDIIEDKKKRKNKIPLIIESNKFCYFCDFNEIIDKHHIFPRNFGGKNERINYLALCPNHHYMIHRKYWEIIYIEGFFYLLNKNDGRLIKPNKRQFEYKRQCPHFIRKFILESGRLRELISDEKN